MPNKVLISSEFATAHMALIAVIVYSGGDLSNRICGWLDAWETGIGGTRTMYAGVVLAIDTRGSDVH